MEVLTIIPARGGSKSIPYKNIRDFAGYPLIAYSIAAGLAAQTVNRVIVSTDDEQIAEVARSYGAEVPFLRPPEISQDNTADLPVFQHALRWLSEREGYDPQIVVQLRPTSPLRRVWHIDQAVLRLMQRPDADSIRTVCIPFQNPFKMWQINPDGMMTPLIKEIPGLGKEKLEQEAADWQQGMANWQSGSPFASNNESSRQVELYNLPRQMLPVVYWQTGYVDAAWVDTILNKNSMTGDRILPLVIEPSEWIDIDSVDDWRRAERLLESGEVTFDDLGFQIAR